MTSIPLGAIPGDWRFDAACDPLTAEEFFATSRRGWVASRQAKHAKDFCVGSCPVFVDCLEWVLTDDARRNEKGLALNEGIWAATDENERRAMLGRKAKTKGRAS